MKSARLFRAGWSCVAVALLAIALVAQPRAAADAAVASDWDPGDIISDGAFYDPGALDAPTIESFIAAKEAHCSAAKGYPCLKDYRESTPSIAASGGCSAYTGIGNESAASIIARVGQACGISQKVLLVMLEKEQGLVSSVAPSASNYASAMGYNCPDTAPCSVASAGFFKQVYGAAWQFQYYAAHPGSYRYRVGASYVQYNPDAGCGGTTIQIKNEATASLYIYTPYQPNPAALANLYGTGDRCSAYGNRNFWVDYNDWFGQPNLGTTPIGTIDSATVGYGRVELRGWAIDPLSKSSINVHVYIDGQWYAQTTASANRSDVAAAYPWYGAAHGYDVTVGLPGGTHQFCAYGISTTGHTNSLLGCQTATSIPDNPIGTLDSVGLGSASSRTATVNGWAIDGDTSSPINVDIYVNGAWTARTMADRTRNDVNNAYPGIGPAHGFSAQVPIAAGSDVVCAYGINVGAGSTNPLIGCQTVFSGTGSPFGNYEYVSYVGGQAQVTGWAIDPDQASPVTVDVTVNGKKVATAQANVSRPDVARAYPGYGDQHGFAVPVVIPVGTSTICVTAENGGPGSDASAGCHTISTPTGPPFGNFEAAMVDNGAAVVTGWAIDPDTASPVNVEATVGSQTLGTFSASLARSDIARVYPSYGAAHGFSQRVQIPVGTNQLCLTVINAGPSAANNSIGCKTVSTATGSPTGNLESVSAGPNSVTATGWALDPDQAGPVTIEALIDGAKVATVAANASRPDVGAAYPGYGNGHGFTVTAPASLGSHTLCLTLDNAGPSAANSSFGCRAVTVTSGAPIGNLEIATVSGGWLQIRGWAFDPDGPTTPVSMSATVNGGAPMAITANVSRADIATAYAAYGAGPNHGFTALVPLPSGTSSVCLTLTNIGPGADSTFGCHMYTR